MLPKVSSKAIVGLLGINTIGGYVYIQGEKNVELMKIQEDAKIFAQTGMIFTESPVSSKQKRHVWNTIIKPHMMNIWTKTISNYNDKLDLVSQLDQPIHGKTYNLTSTNDKLEDLPRLFTENYRAQAIIGFMIDPTLQLVDFGTQTHWKYKFLRDPLWKFLYEHITNNQTSNALLRLEGSDQSWHITVIKNKNGEKGEPIPWATHIDGGENNAMMRNGWPPLNLKESESKLSVDEMILLILLHQIAILFYCETPGNLGVDEGATGFFPHSHRAVINTFRKILNEQQDQNVPHSKITAVLRLFGKENSKMYVKQCPLQENQVLLAFSTLVHTPMWAVKSMDKDEIRVIQNCKIKFSSQVRNAPISTQREVINRIPKDSLIFKIASNQLQDNDVEVNETIQKYENYMYQKYSSNNK